MSDGRPGRRDGTPRDAKEPAPERPPRPAMVELVSAFLIVNGLVSLLVSAQFAAQQADSGIDQGVLPWLSVALGVGSVVIGALVRYGRAWLVALNVAAVLGFLELISATPVGFVFGGVDVFVVLVLVYERPWFAWTPSPPEAGVDR